MPSATSGSQARSDVHALLEPVVAEVGYDLEDVTVQVVGRRSVVRVIVDSDHGVDLDAVAAISRAISAVLDADAEGGPEFAGPYLLEVSSPGVDRPLTEPRHWRRAVGRLVTVEVSGRSVRGRVTAATDTEVMLDSGGDIITAVFASVGPGRVQVEFNRPGAAAAEEPDDDEHDEVDELDELDELDDEADAPAGD